METTEDLNTEFNEQLMILKKTHDEMKEEQLNIPVRKLKGKSYKQNELSRQQNITQNLKTNLKRN